MAVEIHLGDCVKVERNLSIEIELLSCRTTKEFCSFLNECFYYKTSEYPVHFLTLVKELSSFLINKKLISKTSYGKFLHKSSPALLKTYIRKELLQVPSNPSSSDKNSEAYSNYVYSNKNWSHKYASL